MKEDKDTRVVEVFTGSPWEAEFIKGLLESNGIESILKDGGGLAALALLHRTGNSCPRQ